MNAGWLPQRAPAPRRGGASSPLLLLALLLLPCCCPALCPHRCLCNEDTLTVWCDGGVLHIVPITLNPHLQELHLNGNRIVSVKNALLVYGNLRYLDMSQNQLSTLEEGHFLMQKDLRVLHLNGNKVAALKAGAFLGLQSLKVLRLDGNTISDIADKAFDSLQVLESLDLSRNAISSIGPDTFPGLRSLKELLLRDNKLSTVPTDALRAVSSTLRSLDLGVNPLHAVGAECFRPLRRLQVLSLDGCGIHIIEQGAFLGLEEVASLFLQDNELQGVPVDPLLDVAATLRELHVGQNGIRRLGPGDFRGLASLRTISVNGEADLEVVENGTFEGCARLERLVISHNGALAGLEGGALRGLPSLRHLSLRGNGFTTFREDLLPSSATLEVLDLRDNPLTCNCSLLWLWRLLRRESNHSGPAAGGEDPARVRCAGPPPLGDRFLAEVGREDLGCEDRSLVQVLAIAVAGAGVLLVAAVLLGIWHRYRYTARQKSKLMGQSKRSLYQCGQQSENFSPILSQVVQQPFKNPAIAEL